MLLGGHISVRNEDLTILRDSKIILINCYKNVNLNRLIYAMGSVQR